MSRKTKESATSASGGGRKIKTSKARFVRDGDGFYHYKCSVCEGPALYRLRQRHPQEVMCKKCRGIA